MRRGVRPGLVVAAFALAALLLGLACDGRSADPAVLAGPPAVPTPPPAPAPPPEPRRVEYVLSPDDTLFGALVAQGVTSTEVDRLLQATQGVYDLGHVRAGNRLELRVRDDGCLDYFRYDIDPERYVEARPDGETLAARVVEIPYRASVEALRLSISDCLYCDAELEHWDPNVLEQLAEDIFAWSIDFDADVRSGDLFAAAVERRDLETGVVRYGRVLGALAFVGEKVYAAAWYRYGDKEGYYDPDGHSVRLPFLRSPLPFARVSSGFTYRRLHPILRIVRPHLGVDFAAPAGTPVRAAADGLVIFRGRERGFGNFIKLRHAGGYETWYGHLQSFAKGVAAGKRVRQGSVIGYVGSTGLATGPHLDYRMKAGGRMVNPLAVKFLPGEPIPRGELARFREKALAALAPLGLPATLAAKLQSPVPEPKPAREAVAKKAVSVKKDRTGARPPKKPHAPRTPRKGRR